ncbi:Spore germination protein YndE [Paenibacillus allorhizoplanae]|uniref:Spore germination protein YndE n=1 Tax=Paenibacillus allorhizoplanae TaxID=2905648 RepID=A0ABM9CH50_9BACL|nr:endospore germination permease [Paenibacillus allorhizoplanae]CAH1212997.1 Spore germination protein YndE [Paenibacillus allorhizoplanae]
MEHPRQVTVIQAAIILISTIIGVGVLALSLFAVRAADSGAPLVTLLGFLVGLLGLWLLTKLGMRFPTKSIIEYSEDLIGKWPARGFSVLIILFFCLITALASREFGEVVVTSVLTKTPLEVTVIVMLLLAAVSARVDITTFTYFHHFYFPIIVFPGLVIVVLSLKNAHLINLLPLWGNEPTGMPMGILTMAALFQGSFVMTIVIPAMRRPEKAMIAGFIGMLAAGSFYILIVIATVGVFGAEEIKKLVWPTLELAKTTSLPANILERLDGAFLAVWVTAVFTTLLSSYYLAIYFSSQLLRLRDHKMFTFLVVPFIYVIAMFSQNLLQMYEIIQIVGRWGLIFTVAYPLVLFVVAMIRKKKNRGDQLVAKSD